MPVKTPEHIKTQVLEALASGLMPSEIIKSGKSGGVSIATIDRWRMLHKTDRVQDLAHIAVQAALKEEKSKVGHVVRQTLGSALAKQASVLADNPGSTVEDLRNTPQRQGLAAVAKTLAETGAAVFGWSASDGGAMVKPGDMRALDDVIDITPEPAKALPGPDSVV